MLRIALALALVIALAAPAAAGGFDWIGKIELSAAGLESDDPQVRLQAVTELQAFAVEWARPHLLAALRDPDPAVRAAAGRYLGRHGVAEAAPIVIRWLSTADPQIKQHAVEILGDLALPESVPPLVRSLGDSDPEVRVRAVAALGNIATPEVVVPLVARLEDDKGDVRRAAVEELAGLGDVRAVIPLVGVFDDPSLEVRTAAIVAVGRLGDPAAEPALMRLLRDPIEEVRGAAITALGNLRSLEAAARLIELLSTGTSAQRAKVAFALGQIAAAHPRSPRASRALEALVAGLADGQIRAAAREALLEAGALAVAPLLAHLAGDLEGDPSTAVAILRDLGDPRATPALIRELDRGRISRALVLDALGKAGDERALIPVLALLDDPDPAVRLGTMKALAPMIGGDQSRAADVLVDRLADPDLEVRVLAVEYLGKLGARVAVAPLLELAADADEPRLRAAAIDALGRIGDDRAAAPLLAIFESSDADLRRLAADSLIRLESPATLPRLLALAKDRHSLARADAVRAVTGVVRDGDHDRAREVLTDLADDGPLAVSLAAIAGLGAMGDGSSAEVLAKLARDSRPQRQRAAITALGNLPATAATVELLRQRLGSSDDRTASAAAWALGKLGDAGARAQLRRAVGRAGFATPVNAAAALALVATAEDAATVRALLHHKSPLVRQNGTFAVRRLGLQAARAELLALLADDSSALVRAGAARALGRLGKADDALRRAAERDPSPRVQAAAMSAVEDGGAAIPRRQWRSFVVVDPSADDAPVEQEPYFVAAADGLATAYYTDARGIIDEERFPLGDYVIAPASAVSRY